MATLGDCSTIFQTAFGLNAIFPALTLAYESTREQTVRRLAADVKRLKPEFAIEENDMEDFVDLIYERTTAFKALAAIGRIIKIASGASLVLSFFGLMFAAIGPKHELSNTLLWLFAIYAIVLCPALVLLYRSMLRFNERELGKLWSRGEKGVVKTGAQFREMMIRKKASTPDLETETRMMEEQVERLMEQIQNPWLRRFFTWLR